VSIKNVITQLLLWLTFYSSHGVLAAEANDRAQALFNNVTTRFNTAEALKNNFTSPLFGNGSMTTLDGQTELDASIMCQSDKPYMNISGTVQGGGDIALTVNYYPVLSSSLKTHSIARVSGYCSNGYVSCDSGTFNNCEYYEWNSDISGISSKPLQGSETNRLKGCNCLNNSCQPNPETMLTDHLERLASGIINSVQSTQSRYIVSKVDKQPGLISVYGQDIQQCYESAPEITRDLTHYYQNPQALSFAGSIASSNHDLLNQLRESPSFTQIDTGNTVTCSIRRNIVIERSDNVRQMSLRVGPYTGKHVCRYNLNGDFSCDANGIKDSKMSAIETAPSWNADSLCNDSTNITLADQAHSPSARVRHLQMPSCSNNLQGIIEVDSLGLVGEEHSVHIKYSAENCSIDEEIINQCEALAQNPNCVLQYENVDGTSTIPVDQIVNDNQPPIQQECTERDDTAHYQIDPSATSYELNDLIPGHYRIQMYTVDINDLQSDLSDPIEFETTSTSAKIDWNTPEKRSDGNILPITDIKKYVLILTRLDGNMNCETQDRVFEPVEDQCVEGSTHQVSHFRVEPDSTSYRLENLIPGLYRLQMYTVDINGLESPLSKSLDIKIQSPSANLNWDIPNTNTDGSELRPDNIDHFILMLTYIIETCPDMNIEPTGTVRTLGEGVCAVNVEKDFFEKIQVYMCGVEQEQQRPAMADFSEPGADGVIRITQPDGYEFSFDVSPYLPTPQECVQSCKVRSTLNDTSSNQTGVPALLRNDQSRGDDILKACTNIGECPLGAGETQLSECACTDSFAEAATSLQMLRLAGKDLECSYPGQSVEECIGNIEVFRGRAASCRTHGTQTRGENCCDLGGRVFEDAYTHPVIQYLQAFNTTADLFDMLVGKDTSEIRQAMDELTELTSVAFVTAAVEEKIMNWLLSPCAEDSGSAALINSEMCIFIGEQCIEEWDLGIDEVCIQDADFHCCFKTELARILHQQARVQFPGFNFGTPQSPQCQGFTLEQFQAIDFSKIDLSELHDSIKTQSSEVINQQIMQNVEDFRSGL